ncbi:single-stranded DNA-binding protein [Chryseobacterium sp. A301]
MSIRNRVSLIGRTGSDVEIVTFENGGVKALVSLATNDYYMNQEGEKVEETQWHNLIAFGKTAEILQKYVFKGKEIAVEGKIQYRSYENSEGQKKSITEIRLSEVILLS